MCFLSKLQFINKKIKWQNVLTTSLNDSPIFFIFVQTVLKLMITGKNIIWHCASIEPIRSFLASHGSRHDSKTSWLLDFRTPPNLTDTNISSQKRKRSVLEEEWDTQGQAFNILIDRTKVLALPTCPISQRTLHPLSFKKLSSSF